MIKNIIATCLFLSLSILAQQSDNQSIELPDFVITGTQNISIPVAEKEKPKLFPALTQEFFKPSFSPQELNISKFSNPLNKDFSAFEIGDYNSGFLKLGAGIETLPMGDFYFTHSSEPLLFQSHVYGKNINEYIDNAGYNISGINGNLNLFTNTRSSFLPGLKITLGGNYVRDNYKLFASNNPGYKRENELIETLLGFESRLFPEFSYRINGAYEVLKFKDSNFIEKLLTGNIYIKSEFDKFGVSIDGNIINQSLRNNLSPDDSYLYLSGKFNFLINTVKSFRVKLGIHYSTMDTVKLFSPIASFDLKLDEGIMFYGEYSPHTKFDITKSLLRMNKYYIPGVEENFTTKYNSYTKIAFEFQYLKFFEINLGVSFASIDNLPYFSDSNSLGIFNSFSIDDVNYFHAFINGMFHKGPFGYLYFNAYFNRYKTNSNLSIPYKPNFKVGAIYGLSVFSGLTLETKVDYLGKVYTDINNTNSLNSFLDVSLGAKLNLFGDLNLTVEVNNILNKKNYIFENYDEKPFDIIAGIEYRW